MRTIILPDAHRTSNSRRGSEGPARRNRISARRSRGALRSPHYTRLDDEEPPCSRCFMCRISTTAPSGTTIAVLPVTGVKGAKSETSTFYFRGRFV
jgi:hypothetical protein